jgi:hypothetical protein
MHFVLKLIIDNLLELTNISFRTLLILLFCSKLDFLSVLNYLEEIVPLPPPPLVLVFFLFILNLGIRTLVF